MSLIQLKNLGKWVPDGKKKRWLFRHVNLILPSKGFFAVSGPSGCGKSTFLSLLSGLSKPSEGKIKIGKAEITGFSSNQLSSYRQKIVGLVFQHYNLIDYLTVLENVTLPGSFHGAGLKNLRKKARKFLNEVGLSDKEGQVAGTCSGGEKQRIAICRALINDPCVLLCDEPTGALDEESSENVMQILKKVSEKRLVVIVSHNQKLLDRYVDFEWRFGMPCPSFEEEKANKIPSFKKRKGRRNWQMSFLKKDLKKHFGKNLICIATASLGLVAGLLSFGYFEGNESAVIRQARNAVDYRTFRLQEETKVSVASSPLSIIETRRPSENECYDLLGDIQAEVCLDFTYFIPEASVFSFNGENQDPVSLYPVYSFDDPLLWDEEENLGDSTSLCFVNEAFSSRYPDIALWDSIRVSYSYEAEDSTGKIEVFYGDFEFEIAKVVKDFPFMSSPKVYYSYVAFEEYFKDAFLPNGSSIYNFVESTQDNSSYSAFSRYAFCKTFEDADRLAEVASSVEEGVVASNNVRIAMDSFSLLSKGTSWSLLAFTAISLISVGVVTGMSNYSSFLEERKERAILFSLGAYKGEVNAISYFEALLSGLLSGIASLLFCPLTAYGGNLLFQTKFGLENLISIPLASYFGFPFLVPLLILAFSIFFNLLCCFFPLAKANRCDLSEELRDE